MFDQFLYSFSVVAPIFILLALGSFIRQRNIMSESGFRQLNRLCFTVLLPSNVFYSIATANRSEFHATFGLLIFVGIMAVFLGGSWLVPKLESDRNKCGVVIQALIRGNFIILGFAILQRLYGKTNFAVIGLILLISMPLYNITSVVTLERFQMKRSSLRGTFLKILLNPMIIATILGIIAIFLPVPSFVMAPIQLISQASGTIALIALGGLLQLRNLRSNQAILWLVSLVRMLLLPMLMVAIAYWLGFDEPSLMTIMLFFGSPVAVVSFSMVERIGGDEVLAGQLILFTTILSLFSYTFWIALIRSLFA